MSSMTELMSAASLWDQQRDLYAARLVRLVQLERIPTKDAMAQHLGVSRNWVNRLVTHVNDPKSPFKPLRHFEGRWVVPSSGQFADAMVDFEEKVKAIQGGLSESRHTNAALSRKYVGADHEVTQAVSESVAGNDGRVEATKSYERKPHPEHRYIYTRFSSRRGETYCVYFRNSGKVCWEPFGSDLPAALAFRDEIHGHREAAA